MAVSVLAPGSLRYNEFRKYKHPVFAIPPIPEINNFHNDRLCNIGVS
jgi:hypothetical protein